MAQIGESAPISSAITETLGAPREVDEKQVIGDEGKDNIVELNEEEEDWESGDDDDDEWDEDEDELIDPSEVPIHPNVKAKPSDPSAPNPNDEGVRYEEKPVSEIPPERRVWLCLCGTYNSIKQMGDGDWKCITCKRSRNFINDKILEAIPDEKPIVPAGAQAGLILPDDSDGDNEPRMYRVFICSECSYANKWDWTACTCCRHVPTTNERLLNEHYTDIKPIKLRGQINPRPLAQQFPRDVDSFAANQLARDASKVAAQPVQRRKKKWKPSLKSFGKLHEVHTYPRKGDLNCEEPLKRVFGTPFRQTYLISSPYIWNKHRIFAHPMYRKTPEKLRDTIKAQNPVKMRGFVIDPRSGWLATMSETGICIWEPTNGGLDFSLYTFKELQFKTASTELDRLRFMNDNIFIYRLRDHKTVWLRINRENRTIEDGPQPILYDAYLKKCKAVDMDFTDEYAIIIFGNWLGIYEIEPKFKWHHAVAYAYEAQELEPQSVNVIASDADGCDPNYESLHFFGKDAFDESDTETDLTHTDEEKRSQLDSDDDGEHKETPDNDFMGALTSENHIFRIKASSQFSDVPTRSPSPNPAAQSNTMPSAASYAAAATTDANLSAPKKKRRRGKRKRGKGKKQPSQSQSQPKTEEKTEAKAKSIELRGVAEEKESKSDMEQTSKRKVGAAHRSPVNPGVIDPVGTPFKYTNQNYAYIVTNKNILAVHPSNPTFDFLHCATNLSNNSTMTVSKQFGTFHIADEGRKLVQSPRLSTKSMETIIDLTSNDDSKDDSKVDQNKPTPQHQIDMNKAQNLSDFRFVQLPDDTNRTRSAPIDDFKTMLNCAFDEYFGISGRLIIYGILDKDVYRMIQLWNWKDFSPLLDEIETIGYRLDPGLKRFNLTVFVYEYLYGDVLIENIIDCPNFNAGLLLDDAPVVMDTEEVDNDVLMARPEEIDEMQAVVPPQVIVGVVKPLPPADDAEDEWVAVQESAPGEADVTIDLD